jgi:nitrite reductase/ring-hydroxylating ferredoxin subunit
VDNEHTVGLVGAFPAGRIHPVEVAGEQMVIVCVDGEHYACAAICSHAHAYFDDGRIDGFELCCPLHAGRFDVRTGEATHRPAREPIRTYPLRRQGQEIIVTISSNATQDDQTNG